MWPTLRALRHRNYRLYFLGQAGSLVGTWMQQVAMSWLAYRLTGSVAMLGVVSFAGQIPVLLLAPFGGLWSDRVDRRRLLIGTNLGALAQAAVLAALTLSGAVQVWHLVALALVAGCINAIDVPARQSFVVQLVDDRADLPNAIALNSMVMNAARLLGPGLGGFVVAWVGEGACFAANAVSFLAVLLALLAVRPRVSADRRTGTGRLSEGFAYAYESLPMRTLLLLIATLAFFATPYSTLMPVFAREVFAGQADVLGMLLASAGAGAVAGTLVLASRRSLQDIEKSIGIAPLLVAAGLGSFAASSHLAFAMPALAVAGFGVITCAASINTVIQSIVPDELRGRVMALFTMCFLGVAPVGALVAGHVAERIGAPATVAIGASVSALAGLLFWRRRGVVRAALALV